MSSSTFDSRSAASLRFLKLLAILTVVGDSGCKREYECGPRTPGPDQILSESADADQSDPNVFNTVLELGPIELYLPAYAYTVGETLPLRLHNTEPATIELFRLGRGKEKTYTQAVDSPHLQSPTYNYKTGLDWDTVLDIPTQGSRSGYYVVVATLESGRRSSFPLVLKASTGTADIVVVASTHTWHAYNGFGGVGYYTRNKKYIGGNIYLPYARPNRLFNGYLDDDKAERTMHAHLIRAEWLLTSYLEEKEYAYSVISDLEIEENAFRGAKVVILNVHNEYWSENMLSHMQAWLHQGGNLIVASGGSMYRKVERTHEALRVIEDRICAHDYPELIFSFHDNKGYDSYAPYSCETPDHWTFAGTGIQSGQSFGARSFNGSNSAQGASGWETDKLVAGTQGVTVLARGQNPNAGGADMLIRDYPNGGWIFDASSITFTGSLHDPVIDQVMQNLIGDAGG